LWGIQRYKCYSCGKQFSYTKRFRAPLLWEEYTFGKQTYAQLSAKYGVCIKTIQRHLDKFCIQATLKTSRAVVILMDTTYWGRNFGVMLFKDAYTSENLLKYYSQN